MPLLTNKPTAVPTFSALEVVIATFLKIIFLIVPPETTPNKPNADSSVTVSLLLSLIVKLSITCPLPLKVPVNFLPLNVFPSRPPLAIGVKFV